jgi:Ca2+-binding EF-hand superfamily protein
MMSEWVFRASDAEGVRSALRRLISEHGVQYYSLHDLLDVNNDNNIDEHEFVNGMLSPLNFEGEQSVLLDAFASIDKDSNGLITFGEMINWIHGRQQMPHSTRTNLAESLVLDKNCIARVEWKVDGLRHELATALGKSGLLVTDLLETWSVSGVLDLKEWLACWKKLFREVPHPFWRGRIHDVVVEAFEVIDVAQQGSITSDAIRRWAMDEELAARVPRAASSRIKRAERPRQPWSPLDSLRKECNREAEHTRQEVERVRLARTCSP